MRRVTDILRVLKLLGGVAILAGSTACVTAPSQPGASPPPQPETRVFVYPLKGQSQDLQDRDRYECHNWAVQQTGFDPSAPQVPPHLRMTVASGPPTGAGIATGAMAGAVLGSIFSRPWETGRGALLGAIAGAAVGGVAESAAAQQAREQAEANVEYARAAQLEEQARYYVRALTACLTGRGYEVR
ncbi:MAG TPA: YMGG-like glycine zipper-containing protein [Steroidobacteraceae bacterium]|nr:YMGG-like glycine zipper-containing protein [Steroidobacteraceae bacterium]